MRVSVGFSEDPSSALAGKQAAQIAQKNAGRTEPCDVVLLFSTARHDQSELRAAVSAQTGNADRIYGGGSVGVITNEQFGYAGDEVGVACIWLDGAEWNVFKSEGASGDEEATGIDLGRQLAADGVTSDSPVVLFYDAIDLTKGDLRLVMATWMLQGIEKGLGFLPDLIGGGLQGDHVCTPTGQFTGDAITQHSALAMTFSDDIRIDSTIMHGCRPASTYYTVTKSDGPVILEIDNEPAIPFIDRVLGSAISPEEYPFFLLFGLNHGERWAEYDENNYASRLCLGIDKERNGIVMFEPDMVAGTEFQIMFRSLDLEYMKPKIEELFDRLGDREPVFALYIDCAGRCAGYGGIDMEDAYVLQKTIDGRVPLLGLYSGVEIASIAGKPRGLDWTGVFCLFSQGKSTEKPKQEHEEQDASLGGGAQGESDTEDVSIEALQRMAVQNAAKVLELDLESIAIRHELEQKRRGFSLLAELSVSMRQETDYDSVLQMVSQRINAALNMQRTVVMVADPDGTFIPRMTRGYSAEEQKQIEGKHIEIDPVMLDPEVPVIVTAADSVDRLAGVRAALKLPYFISAPIVVRDEIVALLVTGRLEEAVPFLSRLGASEAETVQAIAAVMATVMVYQRWDAADKRAQIDSLTGLLNRAAFEEEVANSLQLMHDRSATGAFLMVDIDTFKEVNDTHGHLQGDVVLKTLANTLRNNFRSSDIVARLGGDEFAVFCPSIGTVDQIMRTVERLNTLWRAMPFTTEEGVSFYATLSIGISMAPRDGIRYRNLFQKADIALYKAKHQGRDRFVIYDL